jgi:selenocysteine-specific elongation factor
MAESLKQFILGTAGHIDHGKTSLVKAISGYDTDRLKEEKLRGITIELGFAALDLPSGVHVGIVDVPGHEKFVKHMVAGATGIDIVAMIIAADEGVMPQTREHLDICTLLGVQHGMIVLTKIDAVDEEWRELVIDDIRKFVSGTFLEGAPLLPVSSLTGEGIPELIQTLDALCLQLSEKKPSGIFRLPADRVFTMKGFGTVITGTLISGKISVGEPVMIYPSGITTKVRGLQVHDRSVDEASASMRTAINFQGIEKASVNRGDVVARPDSLRSSYMLDVELNLLKSVDKPMKNRTRVRFHTGTAEIPCNLIFLDRESLDPGIATFAQIRLDTPVACVRDDRFVIRSYSPVRTLGGGRILNPVPQKHKRFRPETTAHLHTLLTADPEALIMEHAKHAAFDEISHSDLSVMTNLSGKRLDNALQSLLSKHILIQTDKDARRYIHKETSEAFQAITIDRLKEFHKLNPLKSGMPKGELPSSFPPTLTNKLFNMMLTMVSQRNEIILSENFIRLPGHQVTLEADQSDLRKKFLGAYVQAGLQPPSFKELITELAVEAKEAKNMLMLLVSEGAIVKVKEDLFFDAQATINLKTRLIDYLKSNGEINTPQFKDMTGVSRKYTIPLLEYFDAENITIRIGDIRKLRKQD